MMDQLDLIEYAKSKPYPQGAGHRGGITSMEAANKINQSLSVLREIVLGAIRLQGATASELPELTGCDYKSVQPRPSELAALGLVKAMGRRENKRGNKEKVWVAI